MHDQHSRPPVRRKRPCAARRRVRWPSRLAGLALSLGVAVVAFLGLGGEAASRWMWSVISGAGHGSAEDPHHTRVAVAPDGTRTAPAVPREFRGADCGRLSPRHEARPDAGSWLSPALGQGGRLQERRGGSAVSLPAAPDGIIWRDGAELEDSTGAVLTAGHVDDDEGRLSPWGSLHRLQPCDRVYVAGESGRVHEFAVTDLYTTPQREPPVEDVFRRKGPKRLVMITCSGPTVRDAGGPFRFRYQHNLIVQAVPVGTRDVSAEAESTPVSAAAEWRASTGTH